MPAKIIIVPFCLSLGLALPFFYGCQVCTKYQDVASVENHTYESYIDSVVIIANDSIIGCSSPIYGNRIGSKTHKVNFPINARIKLFLQGDLLKELFLKMPKNTVLKVYAGYDCSDNMEKSDRFLDSSLDGDYCWMLEKMDSSYDDSLRCTELSTDGEVDYVCW